MCRYPGCKSTFAQDGQWHRNHELRHSPPVVIPEEQIRSDVYFECKPSQRDDMLNYQKALLEYGMLIANLRDGISEGMSWELCSLICVSCTYCMRCGLKPGVTLPLKCYVEFK